ncbi:MAG: chemotaxis protein CheW [Methylobacteriaceae bacterium]|nr:chemotaxis protein CheW [Methylobacteriaceae bacterium]
MSQALVITVGAERFGLPVERVGAVFRVEGMTRVPLTAPDFAGLHNLRGKTVAVVHLARRFDAAAPPPGRRPMAVTIEAASDSYAIIVDDVGDVIDLSAGQRIETPSHADARRAAMTAAVYRLGAEALAILDVERLFDPAPEAA